MKKICEHNTISSFVNVVKIDDKGVILFQAEINIRCDDCETPFRFLGLKRGLDLYGATVSFDTLQARLSMSPL